MITERQAELNRETFFQLLAGFWTAEGVLVFARWWFTEEFSVWKTVLLLLVTLLILLLLCSYYLPLIATPGAGSGRQQMHKQGTGKRSKKRKRSTPRVSAATCDNEPTASQSASLRASSTYRSPKRKKKRRKQNPPGTGRRSRRRANLQVTEPKQGNSQLIATNKPDPSPKNCKLMIDSSKQRRMD
jgi:hypothetical protein